MRLYCRNVTIFAPCMIDTAKAKIHSVLLLLLLSRGGKHFPHMRFLLFGHLALRAIRILTEPERIEWAILRRAKLHFALVAAAAVDAFCTNCFDGVLEISYRYHFLLLDDSRTYRLALVL